ncbi:DUF6600 domain-containing protein [Silvibacterium dinghuense]|uniref:FecR protein domain-containing protein n=1 Tax=Silvibacterium dinghuense TaxID=1560006 RepID=A0A4Q1SE89_9BACT|nr:DUF6600 domain-containing protein [Silvibacterium dinghuense]RXS95576.1 hypothetical protein ESZ00_13505 [Silvibacterium dinghuense]GGH14148.1 proline-rich exported protein [Silvibacterium dinghuense]
MKSLKTIPAVAAIMAAAALLWIPALQAQDMDPPARVARIGYLQGAVSLQPSGVDTWNAAPPNYPMVSGDRLYTDQGSRAIIQLGASDVRMWGGTDVTLTNLTDNYEQIGLASGSVRVRVFAIDPQNVIEVDTPNGAVIIEQPGDYRINAYGPDASLVAVNAGAVQVAAPGVNQEVVQGQAVQLYGTNPVELGLVEMPGFDDLDRWSIDRDHHILNSISARYVSREMPGYDDLDDNGNWSVTPDYGPVWYPTGVAVGWQPYTVGHWAYVAPWGYTWVDDTSWGYAPFHYGRWAVIGGRWGWVPGPPAVRPVYSPALVAFVGGGPGFSIGISIGGGGGGVAAWFPLGVAEPYVPWYHCSPHYVQNVNVTNVNVTVIRNTTIINNYNTFITNTRTVNNVNQINVTNVNYVNRQRVVAVPANNFAGGGRVQPVRLNQAQVQQISRAPIMVAKSPAPAPQRPLLQARPAAAVARPVARPALMTPHGQVIATPVANRPAARPVSLPKPQPATAIKPAARPIAPNLKPASPGANARPAAPVNNNARPVAPAAGNNARPAAPENNARPAAPGNAARPTTPAGNQARPEAPTNGNARPATPAENTRPAQQQARPAQQATRPETQTARPETQARPATSEARPAPQQARPTPARPEQQAAKPEARQGQQPQARPQQKQPLTKEQQEAEKKRQQEQKQEEQKKEEQEKQPQ